MSGPLSDAEMDAVQAKPGPMSDAEMDSHIASGAAVPQGSWDKYKGLVGEQWDRSSINPKNVYNALSSFKIPVLSSAAKSAGQALIPKPYADEQDAKERQNAAENPGSTFVGQVLGGGALPAFPKLFGAGGALAGPATSAVGKGAQYLGNAASRVGYGSTLAAGEAAASGDEDPLEAFKNTAKTGGVLEGIGAAGNAAAKYIPRFVFGVKPQTEAAYRARAPQINAADETTTADQLAENAQKLRDPYNDAKTALGDAKVDKRAADMVERQNAAGETSAAQSDAQKAGGDYQIASQKLRESLKAKKTPDIGPDVLDAAKVLRTKISEQSGKAFDVLNEQGESIPLKGIKSNVTNLQNELKIGEHDPILSSAGDYEKLGQVRDYLDKFGTEARPEEVKRLIQMLDQENELVYAKLRAGGYATRGERALIKVRGDMDDELKQIPAYAEAMAPMKGHMDLMKRVNKLVGAGDDKKMRGLAERVGKGGAPEDAATLQELSSHTAEGKDLTAPLGDYENAQRFLQNPSQMEAELQKLPESERAKALMDVYRQTQDKNRNPVNMSKRLADLPETGALDDAAKEAESRKAWLDPVRGVNENTSQGIVRSMFSDKRPNLGNTRKIQYLDELNGTDVAQQAKDLGVKKALTEGFTHGSRNVNLGAFSLGGLAGAGGAVAGKIGQAAGALAGGAADLVGPPTYKKIMDLSMTPGFQKYSQALGAALQRSPEAFYLTHKLLMQKDSNYAAQIGGSP